MKVKHNFVVGVLEKQNHNNKHQKRLDQKKSNTFVRFYFVLFTISIWKRDRQMQIHIDIWVRAFVHLLEKRPGGIELSATAQEKYKTQCANAHMLTENQRKKTTTIKATI